MAKFKYPKVFIFQPEQLVVEFISPERGKIIQKGTSNDSRVKGKIYDWSSCETNTKVWKPYTKTLDLSEIYNVPK